MDGLSMGMAEDRVSTLDVYSMFSKNSSLVNFTILHSNYLVAERHIH